MAVHQPNKDRTTKPPIEIETMEEGMQETIAKRTDQGYKFTKAKKDMYELGYYDCYERIKNGQIIR